MSWPDPTLASRRALALASEHIDAGEFATVDLRLPSQDLAALVILLCDWVDPLLVYEDRPDVAHDDYVRIRDGLLQALVRRGPQDKLQ